MRNTSHLVFAFSRFVYPDGSAYTAVKGDSKKKKKKDSEMPSKVKSGHGPRPGRNASKPLPSSEVTSLVGQAPINDQSKLTGEDREKHHRLANDMIKDHSRPDPLRSHSSDSLHLAGAEMDSLLSQQRHVPHEIRIASPSYMRSKEDTDLPSKDSEGRNGLRSARKSHTPNKAQHTSSAAATMLARQQKESNKGCPSQTDFDVDRAFRRNRYQQVINLYLSFRQTECWFSYYTRRKWELLEGMASSDDTAFGCEELELLLGGLKSVCSSRPTTAGTMVAR